MIQVKSARQLIFDEISGERDRQFNLPGSEFDQKHTINDWVAISTQYVSRAADRKHTKGDLLEQREWFIKAAAVIVAALEHLNNKS
jgi:hypothetical protein